DLGWRRDSADVRRNERHRERDCQQRHYPGRQPRVATVDRAFRRGRGTRSCHVFGGRCDSLVELKRRVTAEDRQLELLEAWPRVKPQLLGQAASELLVDVQCFGLAPASV